MPTRSPNANSPAAQLEGASTPYITMRVGGPLDGVVTMTATGTAGLVRIEAAWGDCQARERLRLTRIGEREARTLADACAEQLAAGCEPTRELLRLPRAS